MSWVTRWMQACAMHAGWSKDPKRGVGAVIVNDRNVQVSGGWNGVPRGVVDLPARYEPAAKDHWCEHAERNAIYNAAAEGIATRGTTIYSDYFPCCACARAIIQSGIVRVVAPAPDTSHPRWGASWHVAKVMFHEAGVAVAFV